MSEINLSHKDESKAWIEAKQSLKYELSEYLSFFVPGYQHMPKFKNGWWDGRISLYKPAARSINIGLIPKVASFCKEMGYVLKADETVLRSFDNSEYDEEKVDAWLDSLTITDNKGEVLEFHQHQVDAIHQAIKQKRMVLLSPTSSGKSLIIYCVARWFIENHQEGKVLIVVPTTSLVEQLYLDIVTYSAKDPMLPLDFLCHRIYAGKDKQDKSRIYISTWQSLYNLDPEWFKDFSCVIIDECHNAKGNSLQKILDSCVNARFRIGTTGTLDDSKVNSLIIKAALGPIRKFVTTRELMDIGINAMLEIKNVIIDHDVSDRPVLAKMQYKDEISFIENHQKRSEKIASIVENLEGNVLVLFQHKSHGKKIVDSFRTDRKRVFLLHGDHPVEERTLIKRVMESETNIVLVASYGIFSTGESVKNINHVVFGSPSKSRIRVLQSIGRGLRIKEGKTSVILWDIVDDLSSRTQNGSEKKANITLNHFRVRMKMYDSEKLDYTTETIKL